MFIEKVFIHKLYIKKKNFLESEAKHVLKMSLIFDKIPA